MQSMVSTSPGVRPLVGLGDWMERGFKNTDVPLTRRALSGYRWQLLPELVELMGIEPMTS